MTNSNDDNQRVVPVYDEEVVANKRAVKTGSVRVQKHVDKRTEKVSMPLMRETVEVRRVPVNRVVESMPQTRTEGETTIIPVVEEELVVTKRLVLKEEIYMTRKRTRIEDTQDVTVARERAEVMRMDAEGRVVNSSGDESPEFKINRHRNILNK